MDMENGYTDRVDKGRKEVYMIGLTAPMLYDRLHTLSAEYSLSVEVLVNIAVRRLIEDVDLVRDMRLGKLD